MSLLSSRHSSHLYAAYRIIIFIIDAMLKPRDRLRDSKYNIFCPCPAAASFFSRISVLNAKTFMTVQQNCDVKCADFEPLKKNLWKKAF